MLLNPFRFNINSGPIGDMHWNKVINLLYGDEPAGSSTVEDSAGSVWAIYAGAAGPVDKTEAFNGRALAFIGSGDRVAINPMRQVHWGGTCTVEARVLYNSFGVYRALFHQGRLSDNGIRFQISITTTGVIELYVNDNGITSGPFLGGSLSVGVMHHVAMSKVGTSVQIYLDGVRVINATLTQEWAWSGLHITRLGYCRQGGVDRGMAGYLEQYRFTRDLARYTDNFTPPTEPHPGFGPTSNITLRRLLTEGVLYLPHRGAANIYPEHSMLAYDISSSGDVPVIEMDVRELSDGGLAINHDDTLDATTNGTGLVSSASEATFDSLVIDCQNWFGASYPNQPTVKLAEVLTKYNGDRVLFADIKYPSGTPGAAPSQEILALVQSANIQIGTAIFGSFDRGPLAAPLAAGFDCAIAETSSPDESISAAIEAGIGFISIDKNASSSRIAEWINAGFTTFAYTVNRRHERDALLSYGVHGMYSDDPNYIAASSSMHTQDDFASGNWMDGMLSGKSAGSRPSLAERGRLIAPNYWGYTEVADTREFCLQGWACPIKGNNFADNYTISMDLTFDQRGSSIRWAMVAIADGSSLDRAYTNERGEIKGYAILLRVDGLIEIYREDVSTVLKIADTTGPEYAIGEEAKFEVVVTPTTITVNRKGVGGVIVSTVSIADSTYRGGYFHLGRRDLACKFRNITIT